MYLNTMDIEAVFSNIRFDDHSHTYWIDKTKLISTTTVIKKVTPPFPKDLASKKSAARDNMTQAQVLAKWELSGKIAIDKGNKIHAYSEDLVLGIIDPVKRLIEKRLLEYDAVDKVWDMMRANLNAKVVGKEITIGDNDFGVGGRIDLLLEIDGDSGRELCIFDWKTGKFNVTNKYSKMLKPFHKYDDCHLIRYSLQQSIYRLILERRTGVKVSNSYLINLKDDGSYQPYRAVDLRKEVEEWLLSGSWKCDPIKEATANKVIKILEDTDINFIKLISDDAKAALVANFNRLSSLCLYGDDASDDID